MTNKTEKEILRAITMQKCTCCYFSLKTETGVFHDAWSHELPEDVNVDL